MTQTVEGWVWEEYVQWAMRQLASLVGYAYDPSDANAVSFGLVGTDVDAQRWFDYPLAGTRTLTVCLAHNVGASPISVRVTGAFDEVLVGRVQTVLAVLSDRPTH